MVSSATELDSRNVAQSDLCRWKCFLIVTNFNRLFVRRRPHEGHVASCISPSLKWRTLKLMVWGAINGTRAGPLHRCNGTINQHVYKNILEQHADFLTNKLLAQDNAPCHNTRLIKDWMEENNVNTIPWPSFSPDLNPIEQIWAWMKRSVQGKKFDTKDALWEELNACWSQLTPCFIRRFVDSLPRRIKAVIIAKGGNTSY
jgi:hypothetical protein